LRVSLDLQAKLASHWYRLSKILFAVPEPYQR
jgi:hypothetical protein